jgi:predicted dehydrogenase
MKAKHTLMTSESEEGRGKSATRATRRAFLQTLALTAGLPSVVPAHVLGGEGQTAPSGKISVGVLGVGAQGHVDMRVFLGNPDVRVTAICDINQRNVENARRAISESYGSPDVKVYADFRALNADPGIDAVLMAFPVHWHSIPAVDAILHGKHIYHEKPMALSFAEAGRVRDAVRRKGVVFQFGTQQRSERGFRWACQLARSGRLGKLEEIRVSVPGGKHGPAFSEQPVPGWIDWDRWVGPAPATSFHEEKLSRDNHENMTAFSLGMISCWGIHHLDIAQWGNDTDDTGPVRIQGEGAFPKEGGFDAIERWKVRFEYERATPVVFVNDGTAGFDHGVRFVGDRAWVQVRRGAIEGGLADASKTSADPSRPQAGGAGTPAFLTDPQNQPEALPVQLPVSPDHVRNFLDAIKGGKRAICDIGAAVRGDTLCQLALIAVKLGRPLQWDPRAERFPNDNAANAMLEARPFRGEWKLPAPAAG